MRKILLLITALCIINTTLVFGASKNYTIYIDDKVVQMDVQPELYRNSTFVPVSFIAKELGFTVNWQSPKVTIQNKDTTLVLEVGSNAYTINGETYYTQFMPYISNGRTYVPLRFISNTFGYPVNFTVTPENDGGTIKIDTTKTITPSNTFVDDNTTYILSDDGTFGFKEAKFFGNNSENIIYVKNMQTGEFKEVYTGTAHTYAQWIKNNQLVIAGNEDAFGGKTRPHFMLYDAPSGSLTNIADAYFGDYIEPYDLFIYSNTVYQSDGTDSSNSTFYAKDMKTGAVSTISREKYESYAEEQLNYRDPYTGKIK